VPQKVKENPSSSAAIPLKKGRGRPRKIIAPEALTPLEKRSIETVSQIGQHSPNMGIAAKKLKKQRMNPATSDRSYTADEVEFMNALSEFKRANGRTFPTCSEILNILRGLGYEKVEPYCLGR